MFSQPGIKTGRKMRESKKKKKKKITKYPLEEGPCTTAPGFFISHLKLRRHLGKEERKESERGTREERRKEGRKGGMEGKRRKEEKDREGGAELTFSA